jgi:hypothetical protein
VGRLYLKNPQEMFLLNKCAPKNICLVPLEKSKLNTPPPQKTNFTKITTEEKIYQTS